MVGDYISRDAALTVLDWGCASQDALEAIKSIPAADVVAVRHGWWKPHSKVECPVYHCSVCGGRALSAWGKQCKSDYCPSCGAKMGGGTHG